VFINTEYSRAADRFARGKTWQIDLYINRKKPTGFITSEIKKWQLNMR